jgi:hypothetical protein
MNKQYGTLTKSKRRITKVTEFCEKRGFIYDDFMLFCKKTNHIIKLYTLDEETGEYTFYISMAELRYYEVKYPLYLRKKHHGSYIFFKRK